MSVQTYQTIKLAKGRHRSAEDGACVMELASMLADEAFSDHPMSVSPLIGAFLRAYNDAVDDAHRQDLYAYAAKVVDSNGSDQVEQARIAHLSAWTDDLLRQRSRLRLPRRLRTFAYGLPVEGVGARAVRQVMLCGDDSHRRALAVIDELLAIGAPNAQTTPPTVPETPAHNLAQPV